MRSDKMRKLGLFGGLQFQTQSATGPSFEFKVDGPPPATRIAVYLDFEARHSPGTGVRVTKVAQVVYALETEPNKTSIYTKAVRKELAKAARRLLRTFGRHLLRSSSHVRASVNERDARAVFAPRALARMLSAAHSWVEYWRCVTPEDIPDPALRESAFFAPLQLIRDNPLVMQSLDADYRLWVRRTVARRADFVAS